MICRGSQEKEDVLELQRISVARVKCTKTQENQKQSKKSKPNKKESKMKLQLVKDSPPQNQSAILRATRLDRGPGQETALNILYTTNTLLQCLAPVTLHWVPTHTDIEGNEEADCLAKLATLYPPPHQHTYHPLLAQAPNQGATIR
jgi:hypothetical protein